MSPVEIWGTLSHSARRAACVPFPAPGGPRKMMRAFGAPAPWALAAATDPAPSLSAEAVVVAHDELRLDLGHGVHCHPHHDEERGPTEVEVEVQPLRDPAQVVVGKEHVEGRPDHGDGRDLEAGDEELGEDRDEREVDRPPERDAAQDVVEVLRRLLPGTDAGDEAPV